MRIAYYTAGGREFASSRLRAWMVGEQLARRGHMVTFNPSLDPSPLPQGGKINPTLVIPSGRETPDVVIVQKRFDLRPTMEIAREAAARVIWDCDDMIPGGPVDLADVVTVDTPAKLNLYPGAVVIPDCLDLADDLTEKPDHAETLERVVWFGNADNLYHLRNVAEACRRLGMGLTAITDLGSKHFGEVHGVRGVQWHVDDVNREIIEHDLVVCPYVFDGTWSDEWVKSKSANRVLKAWGLGMPVAGTPILSYVEAGVQYLATTVEEWERVLSELCPKAVREVDDWQGYQIAQLYRPEKIVEKWLEVIGESITAG